MTTNDNRRSFLRKVSTTGIGSVVALTAASQPVLASVSEGHTWEDHQYQRIDQYPYGTTYREWIDLEQWLGIRYNGLDDHGLARFDLFGVHTAVYDDNDSQEMDWSDRRALSGMELMYAGRNGSVTHGPDNASSDYVRGFTPKHKQDVLNEFDIYEFELNDADAVNKIDELEAEYTGSVLAAMTSVGEAVIAEFGSGAIATLGSYVGVAILITGTLAAIAPPDESEEFDSEGEHYRWNFDLQYGSSTTAVGVTHVKNLAVEPDDRGVLDIDVQLTTEADSGYMRVTPLTRDLQTGASINYRY